MWTLSLLLLLLLLLQMSLYYRKSKEFLRMWLEGSSKEWFFSIQYDLTVTFHLQSNVKMKDVVLKPIIAGSMTVSGNFYKNKLPYHKRKLCLCADRVLNSSQERKAG